MAEIPRFMDHQERQEKLRLLIAKSESNFATAIQRDVANERMRRAVTNLQTNITNKLDKFSEDVNGKLDNLLQSIKNLQLHMQISNGELMLADEETMRPMLINETVETESAQVQTSEVYGKPVAIKGDTVWGDVGSVLVEGEQMWDDEETMSLVFDDEALSDESSQVDGNLLAVEIGGEHIPVNEPPVSEINEISEMGIERRAIVVHVNLRLILADKSVFFSSPFILAKSSMEIDRGRWDVERLHDGEYFNPPFDRGRWCVAERMKANFGKNPQQYEAGAAATRTPLYFFYDVDIILKRLHGLDESEPFQLWGQADPRCPWNKSLLQVMVESKLDPYLLPFMQTGQGFEAATKREDGNAIFEIANFGRISKRYENAVEYTKTSDAKEHETAIAIRVPRTKYLPFDRGKRVAAITLRGWWFLVTRVRGNQQLTRLPNQWDKTESFGYEPSVRFSEAQTLSRKLNRLTQKSIRREKEDLESYFGTTTVVPENATREGSYFSLRAHAKREKGNYNEGEMIYLKLRRLCQNTETLHQSLKFDASYSGPFEILERGGPTAHRLDLTSEAKEYPTFLVLLLKKLVSPKVTLSALLPLLVVQWINGGPEKLTCEDKLGARTKFPTLDPWGQGSLQPGGIVMYSPQLRRGRAAVRGGVGEVGRVDRSMKTEACLKKTMKREDGLNVWYGLGRKGVG